MDDLMARKNVPTWVVRLLEHQNAIHATVYHKGPYRLRIWKGKAREHTSAFYDLVNRLPDEVDIRMLKTVVKKLPKDTPFGPLRAFVLGKPDIVPLSALADFWDVAVASRLPP